MSNVVAAQERAKEAIKRQQDELTAQGHTMEIQLGPLEEQIATLGEGIWTMNLDLGPARALTTTTSRPDTTASPMDCCWSVRSWCPEVASKVMTVTCAA